MNTKPLSHDRLQQECFSYLWNSYPNSRYLCFHPKNEARPVSKEILIYFLKFCKLFCNERTIDSFISSFYSSELRKRELSYNKAIGVLPGVLDLIFYFNGVLYGFDIKVGNDKLSQHQLNFITAVESQGGKCFEINSLQQFITIIKTIM